MELSMLPETSTSLTSMARDLLFASSVNLSPGSSFSACGATAGTPTTVTMRIRRVSALPVLSRHVKKSVRKSNVVGDGNLDEFLDSGDGFGGSDGGDDNWFGNGGGGGGGDRWWFEDGSGCEDGSKEDPAFDFVFEVISWIVFSQCLCFAMKRSVELVEMNLERAKVCGFAFVVVNS